MSCAWFCGCSATDSTESLSRLETRPRRSRAWDWHRLRDGIDRVNKHSAPHLRQTFEQVSERLIRGTASWFAVVDDALLADLIVQTLQEDETSALRLADVRRPPIEVGQVRNRATERGRYSQRMRPRALSHHARQVDSPSH